METEERDREKAFVWEEVAHKARMWPLWEENERLLILGRRVELERLYNKEENTFLHILGNLIRSGYAKDAGSRGQMFDEAALLTRATLSYFKEVNGKQNT